MYEVFSRAWWRIEDGKKVPDPSAECFHIAYADSESEARRMCKEWSEENEETILSIKAEYRDY